MADYTPQYSGQFKRDLKLLKKRGYDLEKIKVLIALLVSRSPLLASYKDHSLSGNWQGYRDAHIAPDWLLIYKIINDEIIRFERTGTHSDLFE